MIDTHVHLEFASYDPDRQTVIKRFFENGGKAIVNIGVDEQRIKKSLEIAAQDKRIFVAAGFHPQEATDLEIANDKSQIANKNQETNSNFQTSIRCLEKLIGSNKEKIVAVGEIGLDYFHPSGKNYELKISDRIKKIQKDAFRKQLELARKVNLPVIVHCWDAQEDCWEILKEFQELKMVFHCYGRGYELTFTEKLLKHDNIFFSFTGNITFAKPGKAGAEIFGHLKMIPLERMMFETDGPFLAPVPHRGKRNEPAYIKHIIERVAAVKGIDYELVDRQADRNAISFFDLQIPTGSNSRIG